jgi:hypothetical protein
VSEPPGADLRDSLFAERHRDSLWRDALDWIDARCV